MKTAQLLAIYKDSIIADAGKVVTDSRKFDVVRTDALRKVRDAILQELLDHINDTVGSSAGWQPHPEAQKALLDLAKKLDRMRVES